MFPPAVLADQEFTTQLIPYALDSRARERERVASVRNLTRRLLHGGLAHTLGMTVTDLTGMPVKSGLEAGDFWGQRLTSLYPCVMALFRLQRVRATQSRALIPVLGPRAGKISAPLTRGATPHGFTQDAAKQQRDDAYMDADVHMARTSDQVGIGVVEGYVEVCTHVSLLQPAPRANSHKPLESLLTPFFLLA